MQPQQSVPDEVCRLDDLAVLQVLAKLDNNEMSERFRALSGDQGLPIAPGLKSTAWRVWDWEDVATASRIRIAVPVHSDKPARTSSVSSLFETAEDDFPIETLRRAIAETLLGSKGRTRWIVRGMSVPGTAGLNEFITFRHGVGACCVVDLSGHAAPGLKSDRTSLKRTQRNDWSPEVRQLTERWECSVAHSQFSLPTLRSLHHGVMCRKIRVSKIDNQCEWQLPQWPKSVATTAKLLVQELAVNLDLDLGRDLDRDRDLTIFISRELDLDIELDLYRDLRLVLALALFLDRVVVPAVNRAVDRASSHTAARNRFHTKQLLRGRRSRLIRLAGSLVQSHTLSEGCYPDLRRSSPVLGLPDFAGAFIDGRLTAPIAMQFETQKADDGSRATIRSTQRWDSAAWLHALHYDLVAPFTLQPLGGLQSLVPEWGIERQLRRIGMLPFLLDYRIVWDQFRALLRNVGFSDTFIESGSILLLIPGDELLRKPFVEWDQQQDAQFVVSALWDVPNDKVLWAEGFQHRDSIRKVGKPLGEWLAAVRRR